MGSTKEWSTLLKKAGKIQQKQNCKAAFISQRSRQKAQWKIVLHQPSILHPPNPTPTPSLLHAFTAIHQCLCPLANFLLIQFTLCRLPHSSQDLILSDGRSSLIHYMHREWGRDENEEWKAKLKLNMELGVWEMGGWVICIAVIVFLLSIKTVKILCCIVWVYSTKWILTSVSASCKKSTYSDLAFAMENVRKVFLGT